MVKSLVWIDVGTHAGQELMSIQASDFSFYRKVMRHEAKALIKRARSYSWADLGELARCRHWLRNHRSAMQVVLVEANPKLIGLPVYQTADRVVCAALGGRDDPTLSLGRLYLTGDDACGQGSSIYQAKANVRDTRYLNCLVLNPLSLAQELRSSLDAAGSEYSVILRLNCEGSEDEVIYAFHEIFGAQLVHVFGSLKDVAGVKGPAAHTALTEFMDANGLPFTFFSSAFSSWLDSLRALRAIMSGGQHDAPSVPG